MILQLLVVWLTTQIVWSGGGRVVTRATVYDDDGITAPSSAQSPGYFAMDVETTCGDGGDGDVAAVSWRTTSRRGSHGASGRDYWQPSWEQVHFELVGPRVSTKWLSVFCKGDWPALDQGQQRRSGPASDGQWRKIPRLVLGPDATDALHALAVLRQQRAPAWTVAMADAAPSQTVKLMLAIPFSPSGNTLECKAARMG